MAPGIRYKAFISYSHQDEAWGRWLQRVVESYRVPGRLVGTEGRFGPVPARLAPVFRDREDLSSAADLTSSVKEELAASETLIVICSPAAAASRWVNEEVEYFRALGRGDRILALIVDGDPRGADSMRQCFPPALLRDTAGEPFEPLAADARKWADGKTLARLKLVAGILGIRLDDLRQRDMQRAHRRWMISAAGAMAVAAVTTVLAVVAVTARNQAENRRQHAENLVDYMVDDLKDKLDEVGRLDILEGVGDEVSKYLETLDPREETEESLLQKAKVWRQLGEVGMSQGKLDNAMTAFRASLEVTRELLRRSPEDLERIYEMGQAEFWVGYVHLERGSFEEARRSLENYLEYTDRLAEIDPENPQWLMEQSYAHGNIAALVNRANYDDVELALQEISQSVEFNRKALELAPDNVEYISEYGEALAWQADTQLLLCDLGGALQSRQENLRIAGEALDREPANAARQQRFAYALAGLANVEAQVGLTDSALNHLRDSADVLNRLYRIDPINVELQWSRLAHERYIALLEAESGRAEDALAVLDQIYEPTLEVVSSERDENHRRRQGWIEFLLRYAEVAWLAKEGEMGDRLWDQAVRHVLAWAGEAGSAAPWYREIVLARFLKWHYTPGGQPGSADPLPQVRLEDGRRRMSCDDRSLVVLQALMDGDPATAGAQTADLLGKGYFEPGFIRICRHYDLCQ